MRWGSGLVFSLLLLPIATGAAAVSERGFTVQYVEPTQNAGIVSTTLTVASSGMFLTWDATNNRAVQAPFAASRIQRFLVQSVGADRYQIKTADGQGCLSVPGESVASRHRWAFAPCVTDAPHQQFLMTASPTSIRPVMRPTLCADIAGNSLQPEAGVQQYPCHGQANQRWTYGPSGSGVPLDDLHATIISVDVVRDGSPDYTTTTIPATTPAGGGRISRTLCVPIRDLSIADYIDIFVTAVDMAGNESQPTYPLRWPVAETPTCVLEPSPSCTEESWIIDSAHHVWTFGSNGETLRDGVHQAGGSGQRYRYVEETVYVLGGLNWYRYAASANSWINTGQTRPPCVITRDRPARPQRFDLQTARQEE